MYEISITKIEMKELPAGKNWAVVAERPITEEDVRESPFSYDDEDIAKFNLKQIYGYTPAQTKLKEVTTTVLKQQVEQLNLVAVIKAINSIP